MKKLNEQMQPGPEFDDLTELAPGRVLVVDDNENNRRLLEEALMVAGHRVILAEDGFSGFKAAVNERPDLILLDIMMPGIDGYKVCQKLKTIAATREIPVIFITALEKTEEILKGFAVGGVDYITKPVIVAEMMARVNTHLRLRSLELYRTRMLEKRLKVEHWQAVEAISEGLAHNFNNLLGAAIANTDYIVNRAADPDLKEAAVDLRDSLYRAAELVRLLRTFQEQVTEQGPITLTALLEAAAAEFKGRLKDNQSLSLETTAESGRLVSGAAPYLRRAIMAGLTNAWEALRPEGGLIRLLAERKIPNGRGPGLEIRILDNGRGLTPETRRLAFLPFFSTKSIVGAGLGLYAAKLAIDQIGGQIELEALPEGGTGLVITVPERDSESA